MNERTSKAAYADLLAAVVEALDVPLPSIAIADERAYHLLMERRMSDLRSVLTVMFAVDGDPWVTAATIRRRTADEPVTYTPYKPKMDGADR